MESGAARRRRQAIEPQQVTQYCVAYFRRPVGPWRRTREEALEDAIRRGDATRDQRSRKTVYLTVPADILERTVPIDARLHKPQLRLVR